MVQPPFQKLVHEGFLLLDRQDIGKIVNRGSRSFLRKRTEGRETQKEKEHPTK
jgi:hypothetical protein